jgi:hypothetical protein
MTLAFHQSTFDFLGIDPHISDRRLALIVERERVCGISFPLSVREWYSIDRVESLFYENSNEDDLTNLNELGDLSDIRQGYLCVATENQAVIAWYVKLDGSEDPPVFHNNDEWDEDLSAINWELCSETFSAFIFDMISSEI